MGPEIPQDEEPPPLETIKLIGRTGPDGTLRLEVPVGVANVEVVVVVSHPFAEAEEYFEGIENGWPPGFFQQTAGSLADENIEYPTRGGAEVREGVR